MIGLSHKSAELSLLELFSIVAISLKNKALCFYPYPTIILSTCNRVEIYFCAENLSEAHSALLAYLRIQIKAPFEHRLYSFFGIDCFYHLAKVTSGLDSAVLGESEIQGQVKLAYLEASSIQKLSSSMHYIFQKALRIGKTIRNFLPSRKFSLADAVLSIGEIHFSKIQEKKILLIGNSSINRSILCSLKKREFKDITLISQTKLDQFQCRIKTREELLYWRQYDLIISATKCDAPIVRDQRGSFAVLFDLGVPRNIDSTLERDKTLKLYNIEEIHEWIQKREKPESNLSFSLEKSLKSEVAKFARLYRQKMGMGDKRHSLKACEIF